MVELVKVIDPGHKYLLNSLDGGEPILLTFVKRDNPPENYPGNIGHYPGTQLQEVLRALIERGEYVQNQQPCPETAKFVDLMRQGLYELETRVRHRRHQPELRVSLDQIEKEPTCSICGHIMCLEHDNK